jgi:hypothetical protein
MEADESAKAPVQRSAAAQRPTAAQRVVDGDIRGMSISTPWARALTDGELAQQSGILRTQMRDLPPADAAARQGAEENLRVLEDETRRRTAAQALAGLTLGPDVPRPAGVPPDGGYALMEIPGVDSQVLAQLPEGQLATVATASLFVPPGLAALPPLPGGVSRTAEAAGAAGGAARLSSGINMARWGYPGGLQEGYSIGIVVRPRAGVSGALNLDWGHTSLVLRRAGVPLDTVGFTPDMRTLSGVSDMVRNAGGVERGTSAVPGRFTSDGSMFGYENSVHIEYPINEAQAAQFAMQKPGLAPNVRYTGRPAVFRAQPGSCAGSNCGLWAIGEIESRTGGVVGRVGDPAGITSMGPNGVVQAGRGSQPAIVDMARGGLSDPATIRPLTPGAPPAVVSSMPRVVRVLRVGGKVMLIVGVAVAVYEIATARPGTRGRTAAGVISGFGAGFALGAAAGLICGPGALLCSGVVGLGLGLIGAIGGRAVGEALYDVAAEPPTAAPGPSSPSPRTSSAGGPPSWELLFVPPPTPADQMFGQIISQPPLIRPATSIDFAFAPGR